MPYLVRSDRYRIVPATAAMLPEKRRTSPKMEELEFFSEFFSSIFLS
jgi:hypothetical protein